MHPRIRRSTTLARAAAYGALLLLPVILAACGKGGSRLLTPAAATAARGDSLGSMAAVDVAPIRIPDGFTVWAASDLHGQAAGGRPAARAEPASPTAAARGSRPTATALVVTGDLVDRGPDSLGLVRRLASLRDQAPARGGLVALLEGNHEMQVLGGLAGEPELFRALMAFGGAATLASVGLQTGRVGGLPGGGDRRSESRPSPPTSSRPCGPSRRTRAGATSSSSTVARCPTRPSTRSPRSAERLWIRDAFFASTDPFPEADAWAPYRADGISRVVHGHTPVERPTLSHDGRALNLDTWRGQVVTLARLDPGRRAAARPRFIDEPVEARLLPDAPITPEEIRHLDAVLPGRVDAWRARRGAVGEDPAGAERRARPRVRPRRDLLDPVARARRQREERVEVGGGAQHRPSSPSHSATYAVAVANG